MQAAIESKIKCLGRGIVGSPPGPSQAFAVHALTHPALDEQVGDRLGELRRRHSVLTECLASLSTDKIAPFPFNSGSFALLQIAPEIPVDALRERLLEASTGVISVPEVNAIRLAYCSMHADAIPALVQAIDQAVSSF